MKYLHPYQQARELARVESLSLAPAMSHVPSVKPSASLAVSRMACAALALAAVSWISACSSTKPEAAPVADEHKAAPIKVAEPAPAPVPVAPAPKAPTAADTALAEGLKAYQAGQYRQAETQLKAALQGGLSTPADIANANKHLAFIYCTSKRDTLCASSFKAAKAADASFALTKAEAGHPMWAKTYKKAMGLK